MTIGDRLKEERSRLGFNQTDLAAVGGVGKTTQINYEKGAGCPDASYLAAVAEKGVDVLYVLTGERRPSSAEGISAEEIALVMAYRSMSDAERSVLRRISGSITSSEGSQKLSDKL
ncbi:helix-turn-helix domain-containing protein [Pseudomonas solani]|uniref:helix-turn-helix domain-containing protein n=1 Tax=Pseudomonas solani TaxID=2731552 RepID=UPI003D6B5702